MTPLTTGSDLVPSARKSGDAIIAVLKGEIDLHNSPELRVVLLQLMEENSPKRLIVELSQVPYIDSSAVAVLVEALQKLRKVGGRVILAGLQPRVRGLLEIARLDTVFVLAESEQAALEK